MTRFLRKCLFLLASAGLAVMVTALFLQVLAREFGWAVDWTEELARFSFIAMVFVAAAYANLKQSHLRVSIISDLIASRFGPRSVQVFHTIILLLFAAVMVAFSFLNFLDGLRYPNVSATLRFNQGNLFIAMCLGFAIIFLLHLRDLIALARGENLTEGQSVHD